MLRDPKMQDIMSGVVTTGIDAEKYKGNPDGMLFIEKLAFILANYNGQYAMYNSI
jgi:hypothetical protein